MAITQLNLHHRHTTRRRLFPSTTNLPPPLALAGTPNAPDMATLEVNARNRSWVADAPTTGSFNGTAAGLKWRNRLGFVGVTWAASDPGVFVKASAPRLRLCPPPPPPPPPIARIALIPPSYHNAMPPFVVTHVRVRIAVAACWAAETFFA